MNSTLIFSLPTGLIHVAGHQTTAVECDFEVTFDLTVPQFPLVFVARSCESEVFRCPVSRSQAARIMRFIRNGLAALAMRGAHTDKDQEPTEAK